MLSNTHPRNLQVPPVGLLAFFGLMPFWALERSWKHIQTAANTGCLMHLNVAYVTYNFGFGQRILLLPWMQGHCFFKRFLILVHVSSSLIIAANKAHILSDKCLLFLCDFNKPLYSDIPSNNPSVFCIFHSNLLLVWHLLQCRRRSSFLQDGSHRIKHYEVYRRSFEALSCAPECPICERVHAPRDWRRASLQKRSEISATQFIYFPVCQELE